ncbi:MAG: hypothetical protein IT384_21270 [Deltaproteobacteria bacterium]|nr:hypothetical protein [Deltaproteobacteria bacterium]
MTPLEIGLSLLSGRAGRPWAARAARARAVLGTVYGGQPPGLETQPLEIPAKGLPLLGPVDRARPKALEVAASLIRGLVERRVADLLPLLADDVLVLWPNGGLGLHDRRALLAALEQRPGDPQPIVATQPRSYTLAELRGVLPRSMPDALDLILDLRRTLLVSFHVAGPGVPAGRVMLALGLTPAGDWRSRTLLFGSPDDAHLASSRLEEPALPELAIAAQLVRHRVLGHGAQLGSLMQHLMPKLWLGDQRIEATKLGAMTSAAPVRLGSSEVVFGRTEEMEMKALAKLIPRGLAQKIEQTALETFGHTYDRLSPRLAVTELGLLDPATLRIQPSTRAPCVLVRAPEPDGSVRARAAALFI